MTSTSPIVRRSARRLVLAGSLAFGLLAAGGCSRAESGSLLGAGLGALAGQAIGGDTEATLIGTAIGAGVGYVAGNEQDKRAGYGGYGHSYRQHNPYSHSHRHSHGGYYERSYRGHCDY